MDETLWDLLKTNNNIVEELNEIDNDLCSFCGQDSIYIIKGTCICKKCGTINGIKIDTSAEWRYYGSDDSKYSDPNRCGMPTNVLLPESSLGSTIAFKNNESYEMKKIRNYHMWNTMPYKERSLYNVFDIIQVRALNNGINSCIIEEAKALYKKISETKISRGEPRKGIIASCIYKACILNGSPRSTHEIAAIFKISTKNMTRGCKKFDSIMNYSKNENINISGSRSIDFIRRFCSHLNINTNIQDVCKVVCLNAEKHNIVSKCIPPSVATGSIYLVCNLLNIDISKKDISEQCKISEVTISKCYKELLKYHKHLLPDNILDKLYNSNN
jgi:transcription initiation factor TFIIB